MSQSLAATLERLVFAKRHLILVSFAIVTAIMGYFALQLRPDAGFEKSIPLKHPYMQTFVEHQAEFGGANRILIALSVRDGDIFSADFFRALKAVTDEVFFLPGVDRARVRSIFTPNVRFVEIVEDGFTGGNIVPADFAPTPKGLEQVRQNILKANEVGRLVANDFTAAIISAQLLELDPSTGERLDYLRVASLLEERIRRPYQSENIDIHIIGFARLIGDIANGAMEVIAFFGLAFAITAVLLYVYSKSLRLTGLLLVSSLTAVVWQLGLLTVLGFGLDPMSILVPFLIFAIAVSHGVQMVNAVRMQMLRGSDCPTAARRCFRRLLLPGGVALVSDTIGFLTLLLIDIGIIRELAIAASLGVAAIILTDLVLLPVLLSYLPALRPRSASSVGIGTRRDRWWGLISHLAAPRVALVTLAVSSALYGYGLWQGAKLEIGDLEAGAPELRQDARYNRDAKLISERFSIGVDVISVVVETVPDGCIDYEVMDLIDRFEWQIRNVDGVHSVIGLPTIAKIVNAGWNEGNVKWRAIPRNPQVLVQSVSGVETSTGLLNSDCSVMPVLIFTRDHRAETIDRIILAVKRFAAQHDDDTIVFRLASGNVGVMAATNEAVRAAQLPMLVYVYAAIIGLCLLTFRSWRGTLYIIVPLSLVSVLTVALMPLLGIGLKVSTLPVVALGVGIGVDYGIYIFARLKTYLDQKIAFQEAYLLTLKETGSAAVFTALTLAIGVSTWIYSDLKFQSDMGILLTFMFLANMIGAIAIIPALAVWSERLLPGKGRL